GPGDAGSGAGATASGSGVGAGNGNGGGTTTSPSGNSGGSPGGAGTKGDPHLTTLDGLAYDLQSIGEFQLVEGDELDVQARFEPVGSHVSVATRFAFVLGSHTVDADPRTNTVRLDGEVFSLPQGHVVELGGGASLTRTVDNRFVARWPAVGTAEGPVLEMHAGFSKVYVPPGTPTIGLLGNADGDHANDLRTRDGEQLPATASTTTLHGSFADSWRISGDESLFTYGAGESTDTFTDRSFPANVISLGDLSDSVLAGATAACEDADVADGHVFDDCVYDWALTQDTTFLDAAADDTTPSIEPGARGVAADGTLTEDYEDTVPPNLSSLRYGSGASTGRFAGPFGRDNRYSVSVPSLPGHTSATVKLNLIALGDWSAGAPSPVEVKVDGTVRWTGDLATRTPTATGTTPSGTAYAVHPITLTVPHSAEQLGLGVSAAFGLGDARGLGVDDLDVALDLVAPQQFATTLPLAVSDGAPAIGAGKLETAGSEDVYAFTTAQAGALQVDASACPETLAAFRWRVLDAAGVEKAAGGCASAPTTELPAGDYRVSVMSRGGTGTYQLAVQHRPPAQSFPVTMPAVVADGVPSAGAGNLETTASQDEYLFSVPTPRGLLIDLASCSSTLGKVAWKLVDVSSGSPVASSTATCASTTVPHVAAGQYRLEVTSNGKKGTYSLGIDTKPAPQVFSLTSPANVTNGVPGPGAGNLETTGSEDHYEFTTATAGGLEMVFSNCSPSLSHIAWRLVNATTGATEEGINLGCDPEYRASIPAGDHRLIVWHTGFKGTYDLALLVQPPPETFDVSLPFSAADGQPPAGAGNLETRASTDSYRFTLPAAGGLQVELSECATSLGGAVDWKVVDAGSGAVKHTATGCGKALAPNLAAGSYRLEITRLHKTGTYRLSAYAQPAPDVFQVGTAATISNGVPWAGAGNLETTSSEDHYEFTTTTAGGVQMNFSQCSASLSHITWRIVDAVTGAGVVSTNLGCDPEWRDLPAGQYRLIVSHNGRTGTYNLAFRVQPPPDTFNVTLPVQVSPGQPGAGAGNLETTASNDVYKFSTIRTGGVQVELSACAASLGGYVYWQVIDAGSGAVKHAASGCGATLVPNLPAGSYKLDVSRRNYTGTYSVKLSPRPDPDVFELGSSASISNGVPGPGAGNLETTSSEDHYEFTTTTVGGVQMSFSECSSSLGHIAWRIVNATTGASEVSTNLGCNPEWRASIPAGKHRLIVSRNGYTGTYKLAFQVQPPPQQFDVSLPFSASDGQPAAGAGNLETAASSDVYRFALANAGGVQFEFSNCSSTLGGAVDWKVIDATTNAVKFSSSSCGKTLVPSLPAGTYKLDVWRLHKTGTYRVSAFAQPPPDVVQLGSSASISDGVPVAGAGNLETTASEDHYEFTTTTVGGVQMVFSNCSASLGYITWRIVNATTGASEVSTNLSCNPEWRGTIPAGKHRLIVARNGFTGTYKLDFLVQPPPDTSDVSLPFTTTGNLETTASNDVYRFSTATAGGLQVEFSSCASTLGGSVDFKVIDAATGAVKHSASSCGLVLVPNLPAGSYKLDVSRMFKTGTYSLAVGAQPPPDVFALTSPQSVSNGVPGAGAGNIETKTSEDHYEFTTPAVGWVRFDFSECSPSLGHIAWRMVNATTGASEVSTNLGCQAEYRANIPAGRHRLIVSRLGYTGTYKVAFSSG
ncbi:MAG: hypothetical protein M3389_00340, partial [Actinomycetota bacterium]|nr:hypothetical protein [Actinomycetota bacterium]